MTKLLAIDVGNTNVKYGLFVDGKLTKTWRHATDKTNVLAAKYLAKSDAPCAMACVVPAAGDVLRKVAGSRLICEVNAAAQKWLTGMAPEMGADRVADAVAAWVLHAGSKTPTVVLSFGTASTLLAIDQNGHVIGGWIAPGISTQLEAMHERCALLPLLRMDKPSTALGFDTETHMSNGVFVANIGIASQWIKTASSNFAVPAVSVATGGWSKMLQAHGMLFDHVDATLTLRGVQLIAQAKLSEKAA